MIEFDQVRKSFGANTALNGVSLSVPAGQMWGLLGPNGAGKTTLFRILMGILKPQSGSCTVDGLDCFEQSIAVKRVIGFLPDEPVFYTYLSGQEILELCISLHGLDVAEEMRRLAPIIERLNLSGAMHSFADDYSRGMKKKLGLLLALAHRPKLLVLDEPTNGLDVESTATFYALMREQLQLGTTVVFSTHLLPQVESLCSHAAIIHGGKLLAQGTLAEIVKSQAGANDLEQAFLRLTSTKTLDRAPPSQVKSL